MTPQPLQVQCPSCGSSDITYTCEPNCCFNHICAACYTTFELFTAPVGRTLSNLQMPLGQRDCLAPTVACARCESIEVYLLPQADEGQGMLVCVSCCALLRLGMDAVESR
jgi:hypothetical protein